MGRENKSESHYIYLERRRGLLSTYVREEALLDMYLSTSTEFNIRTRYRYKHNIAFRANGIMDGFLPLSK